MSWLSSANRRSLWVLTRPTDGWSPQGPAGTIKVWPDYGAARLPAAQTIEMRAALAGIARNGRFAVAYSHEKDGGLLSLWDVARQEVTARFNVPAAEPVGPVQVSDDGQWVAVAFARESKLYALVWNAPNPAPREIFFAETHQDTRALSISPDGRLLACQHGDDGLILLDVRTGVPRPLIRSDEVMAACFSQDGRFLVFHLRERKAVERVPPPGGRGRGSTHGGWHSFGNDQRGRQHFRHR